MALPPRLLDGDGHTSLDVSVIVASFQARRTIGHCLRSLGEQQLDPGQTFEVLVVDSSTDRTAQLVATQFPRVRLFTSAGRLFPGAARNLGVRHATGRILAFTDTDCVPQRGWLREIVRAHAADAPAIGGSVLMGNPHSAVAWAAYFCEFSQWLPATPMGLMTEIPACCYSVKPWLMRAYGPFLEGTYCSDTAFNWRIAAGGHRPLFVPSVQVAHLSIEEPRRFLAKQVWHGRMFARVRLSQGQLSAPRRCLLALVGPALPGLLFRRVAGRALRCAPYRRSVVAVSPLVLLGLTAWSLGEWLGYMTVAEPGRRRRAAP